MSVAKAKKNQFTLGPARDLLALLISVISFVISMVNVYINNIKAPDLDVAVAPYIKQVVDSQSLNEAFFVPLTAVNRGAKTGAILSFDLNITFIPTGEQAAYFGQYYAQENNSESIGNFFAPMSLSGYSAISRTVCFYPQGKRNGNFFSRVGTYEFKLITNTANVTGDAQKTIVRVFKVEVSQDMYASMQTQTDKEYVYPVQVKLMSNP